MTAVATKTRPERPQAIIFDWDNTLVDSWAVIHDALNHTLTAMDHAPWTMDETRARVRKSMRDSFPALFGERWEEAGAIFYERYLAVHLEKIVPCRGAVEMLDALAGEGVYLAVVSNKKGQHLREEADYLGWTRYFGRLVGAHDAPRDKPAPDPVDLALEGSGIPGGPAVWFAGDTCVDLECAVAAGCVPVLVRPEGPAAGEFENYPPSWHVSDCLQLSSLVRSL